MLLNPSAFRLAAAEEKPKSEKLKALRKKVLQRRPWKQWKSQSDGTSNIDTNQFAGSVNNEQIRKDNNLTGQSEDASELYFSIVVDPGH